MPTFYVVCNICSHDMCPILFYVYMMVHVHASACMHCICHTHVHVCDIPFQFYETIVRYDKFFAAESRYIAGIMVWGSVCTRSCHGMGICMHTLMSWYGASICTHSCHGMGHLYAHTHVMVWGIYMHTLTCTVCNMTIIEYACVCACEFWLLPLCA